MTFEEIVKAAFEEELSNILFEVKMASPGELRPNKALTTLAPKMAVIKAAPKLASDKVAKTRAVKEWEAAQAAGQQGSADEIAKAYGQLGLKPRQLKDVSTGGEEAGVDLMMGRKTVPSTGEANESGYVARKLYKPDSSISRGEFTPQLLEQKQQVTDQARALSPEAKQMVPAMYGHETMGQGPTQRTVSYHEYVPGISDLRGQRAEANGREVFSRPREKYIGDIENVENKVLNPMAQKGMTLADTVRARSGGGRGINWGNVVNSPQGPKVLDFLPSVQGQKNPAFESYKAHFGNLPAGQEATGSRFGQEQGVGALRKEVFNPQMRIEKSPMQEPVARSDARPSMPPASHGPEAHMPTSMPPVLRPPAAAGAAPGAAGPVQAMKTAPTAVPARGAGALQHAPTMPSSVGTAPFSLVKKVAPAAGGALQAAEHSVATKAPGMLAGIGKFLRR